MKKIIALLCLAAMAVSTFATVKVNDNISMGMKLRTRAWMTNEGNYEGSFNADTQVMTRRIDYRFRPWIDYRVNDMLSAKAYFEFGDIDYGDADNGTGIDSDGKGVFELKQLYTDIKPNKNHKVRVGIQYWEDDFVMLFGNEAAGIMYYGNFGQTSLDLGYLIPKDGGEKNPEKDETVSYGDNLIIAAVNYKMDKNISFGMDNMFAFGRETIDEGVLDQTTTSMWIAPKVNANFDALNIAAKFAYFSTSSSDEKLNGNTETNGEPEASGWAFSLKGGYAIDKQMGVNFDFLYAPGDDEGVDYYQAYTVPDQGWNTDWYCNGTEIMTPGTIDKNNYNLFANEDGIMMPSVQMYYKLNEKTKLMGTFAMASTTEDVITDDGSKETSLGMEFDLKAEIKLYDKFEVQPFVAFFMPGDAVGSDTDMQTKVGIYTRLKL